MIRFWVIIFAVISTANANAVELPAPAVLAAEQLDVETEYQVPIGVFDGKKVPTRTLVADVRVRAWHMSASDQSTQRFLDKIADLLEKQGYRKTLDCRDHVCGGFDFRFEIDVMPAPNMYVNLRDYRFSAFLKNHETRPDQAVTVLESTIAEDTFIQITEVIPSLDNSVALNVAGSSPSDSYGGSATAAIEPFATRLQRKGVAVLEGLEFQTGATLLGEGPFNTLSELAKFLLKNPKLSVVLVGHTDATGSFDGNVRVSKARAEAVRQRMIEQLDVDPARLQAEGMGYLAPRATNLTPTGREANRRVEVVVLPPSE